MEFYDEDDRRDDEFLGRATVQTGAVADRGHIDGFWVDLEECKSGKAQEGSDFFLVLYREIKGILPNRGISKSFSLQQLVTW